jgi:hypothetical protein
LPLFLGLGFGGRSPLDLGNVMSNHSKDGTMRGGGIASTGLVGGAGGAGGASLSCSGPHGVAVKAMAANYKATVCSDDDRWCSMLGKQRSWPAWRRYPNEPLCPAQDRRPGRCAGHCDRRLSHLRADENRWRPMLGIQQQRPARRRDHDGSLDAAYDRRARWCAGNRAGLRAHQRVDDDKWSPMLGRQREGRDRWHQGLPTTTG